MAGSHPAILEESPAHRETHAAFASGLICALITLSFSRRAFRKSKSPCSRIQNSGSTLKYTPSLNAVSALIPRFPREISLIGRSQGQTHVTFWFDDPNMQPVTYLVDGKQYVAVLAGANNGRVFAFALE